MTFILMRLSAEIGKRSIKYKGRPSRPKLWNDLPAELKELDAGM